MSAIAGARDAAPASARVPTRAERLARWIVLRLLRRMRAGELELIEGSNRLVFGGGARQYAGTAQCAPRAVMRIRSARCYRRLLRGSRGLAESYAEGDWESEDLVALARVAALNAGSIDSLRRVLAPLLIPRQRWAGWLVRNTPARSRLQAAAHYDLGNELFSLFLDPTMMYSCAVFDSPGATLEQASLAKLQRVCAKLGLGPRDHVLELGTGWGGFALYAARRYGCRITTVTNSVQQQAYASERVREEGLDDRVSVLLEDYRRVRGRYDKLVCLEMIEAVGWQYFRTFFRRCAQLVDANGAMLLQAIVIDDRAYELEKGARSFINTHIFPGGCLPSLDLIARSLARATDFRQVHVEDLTAHYATTLERWRERFLAAADQLAELGYDERFRRLWQLYLSYCEGGFRERRIQDVQLLLAKPGFR